MADIRPFCAIRPKNSLASEVAALPYDVYNRQEACKAVKGKPLSFLNIDRAETAFDSSVDMYDDCVYQKAHDLLWSQIKEGIYQKDETPCYYLYELTMNGRVQTGIVACASVDDYVNGIIKKHENTRAEKEEDRIRHVDACNAQTGPIFLAYRADEVLRAIVKKTKKKEPLVDFVSEDGIRHRTFVISDSLDTGIISRSFASMDALYIADGHHRAASAVKVGQKRGGEAMYFLSVLFPDDELMIMDYNRVVKDLNGMTDTQFLTAVQEIFDVEKPQKDAFSPSQKGSFSMYLDGLWYLLTVKEKDKSTDPVEGLDVSLLQNLLLRPLLGIEDPKTDARIDFVGGIRGLGELERRVNTDCKVAFAMYPTSITELFAVADAGKLMPPKSTWFEPKLRSGLFIHAIGEE